MDASTPTQRLPLALALSAVLLGSPALAAEWSYDYNDQGLLSRVDGPRTDVADVTRYDYNDRGLLVTVTDALGHRTQLADHNAQGQPTRLTDANGIVTELGYTPRGWLASRTLKSRAGDLTTRFEYDAVGDLTGVIGPDGNGLYFEYDDARRLVALRNSQGERIDYTLDAEGNRTREQIRSAGGELVQTQSRVFDELGRLLQAVGAEGQTTRYAYDPNSNPVETTDARLNPTGQAFDALDRLVTVTDPYQQVTRLSYDALDNLTSVTDPRGLTTTYFYDGLGRLSARISPDTGTTTYAYDDAGNVVERTDALGRETHYRYDALNRRVAESHPGDPRLDVGFSYDASDSGAAYNAGVGRLTGMTDALGRVDYRYDDRGNLIAQTRRLEADGLSTAFTTGYRYDAANRVTGIDYPSGLSVSYQRNDAGQVSRVSFDGRAADQTVADRIQYRAFGALTDLRWGNGLTLSRRFDLDGRLSSQEIGRLQTLGYRYDPVSNLDQIDDLAQAAGPRDYGYDDLNRLVREQQDDETREYRYDAVGNRTERRWQHTGADGLPVTETQQLGYGSQSNRLVQDGRQPVEHDDAGNLTRRDRQRSFGYDASGRLSEYDRQGRPVARYGYNGRGERILKTLLKSGAERQRVFHYDPAGQLLAETVFNRNGARTLARHYIWLGSQPLALVEQHFNPKGRLTDERLAYLHSDHLDTPRLATDARGAVIWRWNSDAFGLGAAELDPDGDGVELRVGLRFPGQYYDRESGNFYNYFRDYDPGTGRYIESDPIGLAGGLNTYAYVGGNPLTYVDPYGLFEVGFSGYIGIGGGVSFGYDFQNNEFFATASVGIGLGGGVLFDPFGGSAIGANHPDQGTSSQLVDSGTYECDEETGFFGLTSSLGANISVLGAQRALYTGFANDKRGGVKAIANESGSVGYNLGDKAYSAGVGGNISVTASSGFKFF